MKLDPQTSPWNATYHLLTASIQPRPIALVSTVSASGIVNVAPFSFFNVICAKPAMLAFSPMFKGGDGAEKDTLRNLRNSGEFVIAAVVEDNVQRVNQASFEYAASISEVTAAGLSILPAERVKAPLIASSPINLECRLTQILEFGQGAGGGCLVIGEVLLMHVDDAVLVDGRIDPDKTRHVGRMGTQDYARTTVGRFKLARPLTETALYAEINAQVKDSSRTVKERLQRCMALLHESQPRHSWTGIYALRGDMLELGPHVGFETEHTRIALGQGLCGQAVVQGVDLDVADVNQAPGYLACSLSTKAEAIVLIRHQGRIVGQIDVDSAQSGAFGEEAMRSLKVVAEMIAPLVADLSRDAPSN